MEHRGRVSPEQQIQLDRIAAERRRKVEAGELPPDVVPTLIGDRLDQSWDPLDFPQHFTANFLAWGISVGILDRSDVGFNNMHPSHRGRAMIWRASRPPILCRDGKPTLVQCNTLKVLKVLCDSGDQYFEGLTLDFGSKDTTQRHVVYSGDLEVAKNFVGIVKSEPLIRDVMKHYYDQRLAEFAEDCH